MFCLKKEMYQYYSLISDRLLNLFCLFSAEIAKHKGPPVFSEKERYKMVRAIKWVDEVSILYIIILILNKFHKLKNLITTLVKLKKNIFIWNSKLFWQTFYIKSWSEIKCQSFDFKHAAF